MKSKQKRKANKSSTPQSKTTQKIKTTSYKKNVTDQKLDVKYHELAETILQNLHNNDLILNYSGNVEDLFLLEVLSRLVLQMEAKRRMKEFGEDHLTAILEIVFDGLPSNLNLTDEEIKKGKQIVNAEFLDQTIEDIIKEVSEIRERGMALGIMRMIGDKNVYDLMRKQYPFDTLLYEILKDRKDLKKKITIKKTSRKGFLKLVNSALQPVRNIPREKLISFIVGVLASLAAAGIYELIKQSIASLIGRAPYLEAQIYEVEMDIFSNLPKWRASLPDSNELKKDIPKDILLLFILDSICRKSLQPGAKLAELLPNGNYIQNE